MGVSGVEKRVGAEETVILSPALMMARVSAREKGEGKGRIEDK